MLMIGSSCAFLQDLADWLEAQVVFQVTDMTGQEFRFGFGNGNEFKEAAGMS